MLVLTCRLAGQGTDEILVHLEYDMEEAPVAAKRGWIKILCELFTFY